MYDPVSRKIIVITTIESKLTNQRIHFGLDLLEGELTPYRFVNFFFRGGGHNSMNNYDRFTNRITAYFYSLIGNSILMKI